MKALYAGIVVTLLAASGQLAASPHLYGEQGEVSAVQQNKKKVTGIINDEAGPVIGASVMEKGTTNGVVTDLNGRFTINVSPNATLVVSHLGYLKQEIQVKGNNNFSITLAEDTRSLDEVVVVGYGTQKKVNMTGAVASVDMSKMTENRPITSLSSGLAGLAPGVFINQGSGQPGADGATIRVRGQGTLNNSDPLVIIDGLVGNMNDINPEDVETISILKDAASAAIYGSRASNGVILITTKTGKKGTAKITYNGYLSWESVDSPLNIVSNYADYMELMNEAHRNSGVNEPFSAEKITEWRNAGNSDPLKYPNTDFTKAIFSTGLLQSHTVSASGGTESIRYFLSGNYMNNEGVMENTAYDRFTGRANIDADVKKWLTLGVNVYGSVANADPSVSMLGNVFGFGAKSSPGMVYRAPDGRYGGPNNNEDNQQMDNPLANLNAREGKITTNKLVARFFGQLRPLKGLSIDGSYSYTYIDRYSAVKPVYHDLWNFYYDTVQRASSGRTSVTNTNDKWLRQQMDAIARYQFDVDKLNVQVMAGASQEKYMHHWFNATKYDLTAPELSVLDAATKDATASGNQQEWAMRSYFGRINLNWNEKYLFEANLRADGSSRFASGSKRWGYFPSFSAGWRINEEAFLKDVSWLDALKIRASWGSLGNNSIGSQKDDDGNYSYIPLYGNQSYPFGNQLVTGFTQLALSNANLTWETTYVTNVGFDFALWNNRLSGTLDYFNKRTEGILISLPAPLVHGGTRVPVQNAAQVRNRGLELELSWRDKIGKVNYFVSGNITYIKNEVTKFKGEEKSITGTNLILEGQPINIQYVLDADRIIQTDEDLRIVQDMLAKNPDAFKTYGIPGKGDLLYKDTNQDGLVNDEDRIMVGHGTNPPVSFGFSFGASWKGLDFSCLLQGVSGLKLHYMDGFFSPTTSLGLMINKDIADGRWQEGRTDATYPRLLLGSNGMNSRPSTFWIQDKSYLRVKNIQLGYTFPKEISRKAFLETLRLYTSIDNALTFTSYKGLDPEVSGTQYPTQRKVTVGINVTF